MLDHGLDFDIAELKRQLSNTVVVGTVSAIDVEKGRVKVKISEDAESDLIPVLATRSTAGDKSSWLPEIDEQVLVLTITGDINYGFIIGSIPKTADSTKTKTDHRKYSDGTTIDYDKETSTYLIDITKADGKVNINVLGGDVSIKAKNVTAEASEKASVKGKTVDVTAENKASVTAKTISAKADTSATVDSPTVKITGDATFDKTVTVTGALTAASVATGSLAPKAGGSLTMGAVTGDLAVAGDVKAGGVSLKTHTHNYVAAQHPAGPAPTEPPIPAAPVNPEEGGE